MSEVKRYGFSYGDVICCRDGAYVTHENYASLQQENERNLKSAKYAAETNRKVVRTNQVLSDKIAELKKRLDEVLEENAALKDDKK